MGRRRSITTDISTDPKLADLAAYGALPLLLYTWSIPHADDWGRMIGDARQFKLLVCPALEVTVAEVNDALDQITSVGLWERYEVHGKYYIAFPEESWFKHQSYISKEKREKANGRKGSQLPAPPSIQDEENGDVSVANFDDESKDKLQHQTPPNATTHNQTPPSSTKQHQTPPFAVSLSPSLSPSPTREKEESLNTRTYENDSDAENDSPPMTIEQTAVARLTDFHLANTPRGEMTQRDGNIIDAIMDEFSPEWIVEAIDFAKENNGHSIRYIEKVLYGWKKDGVTLSEKKAQDIINSNEFSKEFLKFWDVYPNKSEQNVAWESWKQRIKGTDVTADKLITAATNYALALKQKGQLEFAKEPKNFIKSVMYKDYQTAPSPPKQRSQDGKSGVGYTGNRGGPREDADIAIKQILSEWGDDEGENPRSGTSHRRRETVST
jgi:DnaD/phage-associated family protein